jgi:hypothetical protein
MFTVTLYSNLKQFREDYDDLHTAIEDAEAALAWDPVTDRKQLFKVEIINDRWSKSKKMMRCSIIGKKQSEFGDGERNVVAWDLVVI